jgi:hypothetical protein
MIVAASDCGLAVGRRQGAGHQRLTIVLETLSLRHLSPLYFCHSWHFWYSCSRES